IAYIPRLDPRKPAIFGVVCAIAYPLLYLVFVRDRLPIADEMPLIHQPATQVTRGITLLASSVVTALLVMGLRLVIATAGASMPTAERSDGDGDGDVLGRYQRVRALGEGLFEARRGGPAGGPRRGRRRAGGRCVARRALARCAHHLHARAAASRRSRGRRAAPGARSLASRCARSRWPSAAARVRLRSGAGGGVAARRDQADG